MYLDLLNLKQTMIKYRFFLFFYFIFYLNAVKLLDFCWVQYYSLISVLCLFMICFVLYDLPGWLGAKKN